MAGEWTGDTLKVLVKYFASCRERIGKKEEYLNGDFSTVQELLQFLEEQYGLDTTFVMAAVNRNVVPREKKLSELDEVAVFPPVTGG